jgi:signal peptidase I
LGWFLLAPGALGGSANYVIVDGSSMEPTLKEGDLVVVREQSRYENGDLIAFRVATDGPGRFAVVIHRVVRTVDPGEPSREARFVTQGDNNSYLDGFQPRERDIMGKRLVRVPGLGHLVTEAREHPLPTAVAVAGAAALPAVSVGGKRRRRARRGQASGNGRIPKRKRRSTAVLGSGGQLAVLAIAGVSLVSVALGLLVLNRPTTETVTTPTPVHHAGLFSYRAPVDGDVYTDGVANTGEPVYRNLADNMTIRFDYRLEADALEDVRGTLGLTAKLSLPDGWARSLPLGGTQSFTGPEQSVATALSLTSLDRLIDQLEAQAGVMQDQVYTLLVVANVDISGTMAGTAFQDSFAPELAFQLSPLELQLAPAVPGEENQLEPTKTGSIERARTAPASVDIVGLGVRVETARWIALGGLVAGVLGGVVLLVMVWLSRRADEPERIAKRYRPLLITRARSEIDGWGRVIEVDRIEDLARIATKDGCLIVHQDEGAVHGYYVTDGRVTYRYTSSTKPRMNRSVVQTTRNPYKSTTPEGFRRATRRRAAAAKRASQSQ